MQSGKSTKPEHEEMLARACQDAGVILIRKAACEDDVLAKAGKAVRECGRPFGSQVSITVDGDGKVRLGGRRWCHRRCCPRCSLWRGLDFRQRIIETCQRWEEMAEGNSFLFATLTLAHKKAVNIDGDEARTEAAQYFAECDELLDRTWQAFSKTYKSAELEGIGWRSQLRRNEVTVGPGRVVMPGDSGLAAAASSPTASYHHHIHALVFTEGVNHKLERGDDEDYRSYSARQGEVNLALSHRLHAAWSKSLESVLRRDGRLFPYIMSLKADDRPAIREPYLEEKTKVMVDEGGHRREIRFTTVKGGATLETTYGNTAEMVARYLAAEVTSAFSKVAKGESSFSFRQAIELFGANAGWLNLTYAHWVKARSSISEIEWGRVKLESGKKARMVGFETFCTGGGHREKRERPVRNLVGVVPREAFEAADKSGDVYRLLDEARANGDSGEKVHQTLGGGSRLQERLFEEEQKLRSVRLAVSLIRRGPRRNGRRGYDHRGVVNAVPKDLRREILRQLTDDRELELRKEKLRRHPYEVAAAALHEMRRALEAANAEVERIASTWTAIERAEVIELAATEAATVRQKIARKIARTWRRKNSTKWMRRALAIAGLELLRAFQKRERKAAKIARAVSRGASDRTTLRRYVTNLLREAATIETSLPAMERELARTRPPTRLRGIIERWEALAAERDALIKEWAEHWLRNCEAAVAPLRDEWRASQRVAMLAKAAQDRECDQIEIRDAGEL